MERCFIVKYIYETNLQECMIRSKILRVTLKVQTIRQVETFSVELGLYVGAEITKCGFFVSF